MHIVSRVALAAALVSLAPALSAQFSPIPNTGCAPTTNMIKWSGTGQLSTQIDVKSGCSSLGETPYLFIGGRAPSVPLGPPLACTAGCVLAVRAWVAITGSGSAAISLQVPNNPALIGATLRFQGACVDTVRACLTLTMTVELTIN